ncbi:hypothetical protein D4739_15225 [Nocardioides cavernaquae]|uniref:Uncharacterized protein n=1 Tax=Nocardioides cavernaquae TaxID=2321396 RepID=A0A3A5H9Z1_9ACTN|nr:hypothetical protein D4739_15225 [Nocardioides cavernaquae]
MYWADGIRGFGDAGVVWALGGIFLVLIDHAVGKEIRYTTPGMLIWLPSLPVASGIALCWYMFRRTGSNTFGLKVIPTAGAYGCGLVAALTMAGVIWAGTW